MHGYCSGSQRAVLHRAIPAPACILRGARCAAWRSTPSTLASSSIDSRTKRSPPPLLPAPEAATFSTAAGSPDSLGRLRHLTARLSPQHASKREALVKKEEAAARQRDQLAELRQRAGAGSKECKDCGEELELCLFPADKSLPGGRHHLCFSCRTTAYRRNRVTGKDAPIPRVSAKPCTSCGQLREAEWFYVDSKSSTGLTARCMPCTELYDQKRGDRIRRESKSQEPAAEKECRTCEQTLPISSFHKNPSNLDGLRNDCKACKKKVNIAQRLEREERFRGQPPVAPAGEERICSACETAKPWSEFYTDLSSIYGIGSICKACVIARTLLRVRQRTESSSASES